MRKILQTIKKIWDALDPATIIFGPILFTLDIIDILKGEITGYARWERIREKRRHRYSLDTGGVELDNIPFGTSLNEVIYTEGEYDEPTNRFILENIETARKCFANHNLRFVYLPLLYREIMNGINDAFGYYCPGNEGINNLETLSFKSDFLLNFMMRPENRHKISKPSLAKYNKSSSEENDGYVFTLFYFDVSEAKDTEDFFNFLAERISEDHEQCFSHEAALFSTYTPEHRNADEAFDKETMILLKFVEQKIEELRGMGISEVVLEKLLKPKQKLSRIVVKKDFKIVLPDYDDMEIHMEPLVKAVFLLFLRHNEGIRFKELTDYRDELADIYEMIMGRKALKDNKNRKYSKSIINVTDPLNNSINEKCTRIKEAFLMKFHLTLAENYFVTGKRGEPKRIKLPKELIIWEEELWKEES